MIREFRVLTVAELFDAFLKVFFNKQSLRLLLAYFLVSLIAFVPIVVVLGKTLFGFFEMFVPHADFSQLGLDDVAVFFPNWLVIAVLAVYAFASIMFSLVSTDLYGSRFFERPFSVLRSFVYQLRKIPAFIVFLVFSIAQSFSVYPVMYLFSFLTIAFTMAFPGMNGMIISIIVYTAISVAVSESAAVFFKGILPAMAFDRLRFFRSIGRSVSLFSRDFLRLDAASILFRVLVFLGAGILTFIFVAASILILSALHLKEERVAVMSLFIVFASLGFLLFITNVAGAAFNTVLYCNQKVKREGLGVELLARRFIEENSGAVAGKGAEPSST
ncbi:MAG: hypothetical protein JXD23_16585 [Spirochaetales bacterium]|nr:hypothetical protein [Spirochaetales bacterium]